MSTNDKRILIQGAALEKSGAPFVLATVVRAVSPASAKPGAKAIVSPDGQIQGWIGGGCAQPAVLKSAREALKDGQARLIRISPSIGEGQEEGIIDIGMTCHSGGTLEIFIEPVLPRPMMAILGGSPTARALSGLATRVGFEVIVACPGADRETFSDAEKVISGFDLGALPADRPLFVVVATQGQRDLSALQGALASGVENIAFVASAKKLAKLRDDLLQRGNDAERIAAIHAPAGLDIGAVTPEEIALSVLAGIVQTRRSGRGGVSRSATLIPEAAAASGCCGDGVLVDPGSEANLVDPVCGMSVSNVDVAHRANFGGGAYVFCSAGCQRKFVKSPAMYLERRGVRA